MLSNLPPGVTEGMIPGNTQEDLDWDELWDWIADTPISALALQGLVLGWCKRNKHTVPEPRLKPPMSEPPLKPRP